MALSKEIFADYIKTFQFRQLFNDMGWNNDKTVQPIVIDDQTFMLKAVAEKSGFRILRCDPAADGKIPDFNTRKKIETKVTRLFQEHLIIFHDSAKQDQVWQLAVRQTGRPVSVTETRYHVSQDPELLYQRASGLFFELDEEEKITIVDVTKRVADNFHQNNEKVTKKFYDGFKKEHTSFLTFIKGIDDKVNKDWYASLMLNRLMFCYFIQKKGFLDSNKNYLRDKLKVCQEKKGKNKFYSFYRDFLLALFHQGLGGPAHSKELADEIGKIPYLNGGLFDEHELERMYTTIDIDDTAFERIFDFFDQYEWHLDTRVTATGKDINPDVIGYIFEKYINDRAQMGAYYTKEDITEYISKNCVIPYLFDETKRRYPRAFAPEGEIWHAVKESGDYYLYDAVKYGINADDIWGDLPDDVKAGLDPDQSDLVEKRRCWNRPAPVGVALPTEIWREVIERRKRYVEVKGKIENGEIADINDFITYNLNIRQFAQDVVENTVDPEYLRHFYKVINEVTILDPTCGSGAFLFAAMNVLEPIYEASIKRMEIFVQEATKGKHKFFEETLTHVKSPEHPNLKYFIFKSIILNNLYGVDIMKEAVEIAKLRLFLKLVATVDADYRKPNLGLEPLPDVDFNIRAGNTLIGYANEKGLHEAFSGRFDFDNDEGRIKEKCDVVAHTFARYKEIQLTHGDDYASFRAAKEELNERLKTLNNELHKLLHKQAYGKISYDKWLATHQPFHWFAEFYEIVHDRSGFDVIIGNPPYVEYTRTNVPYVLRQQDYKTLDCGNLYAFVSERCNSLGKLTDFFSFIVPSASVCTPRMSPLEAAINGRYERTWTTVWDERPSKLFDGVDQQLAIHISTGKGPAQFRWMSAMRHWSVEERDHLFSTVTYLGLENKKLQHIADVLPKIVSNEERQLLTKMYGIPHSLLRDLLYKSGGGKVFYRNAGGRYWRLVKSFPTSFKSEKGATATSTEKTFTVSKDHVSLSVALLSSNFFYWFWRVCSNCRHLTDRELSAFPISVETLSKAGIDELNKLAVIFENRLNETKQVLTTENKRSGTVVQDVYFVSSAKPIIDKIDKVLAEHYGFTPEELDFIINYDIKYRMGKELEGDEDS